MFAHDYTHASPPRMTGRPTSLEGQIALRQASGQEAGRQKRARLLFDAVFHQIGRWMSVKWGNSSSNERDKPYFPAH